MSIIHQSYTYLSCVGMFLLDAYWFIVGSVCYRKTFMTRKSRLLSSVAQVAILHTDT